MSSRRILPRSMGGTSQVYARSITACNTEPLQPSHLTKRDYGLYLPLPRMTVAMFAPCLLGCRGTSR